MLLHEKLRLQRRVNKLRLRQLQASSRKDRITKNIERVQKMYSKRESKLQKMAQMMQSQFNVWAQNMSGLGTNGLNPMAYAAAGGLSLFTMKGMQQWAKEAVDAKYTSGDNNGNLIFGSGYGTPEQLLQAKQNGTLKQNYVDDPENSGKQILDKERPWTDGTNYWTNDQVGTLNAGINQISMMEQMQRANVQQMSAQYQNNISIWLEAQEAQLEAEQDAALLPLQEQETEWDLEANSCQVLLESAKQRLQAIESELGEAVKDSAPKFGLG